MSYLKFDKRLMANLEQSLSIELLRTNRMGAYHCTSLVDCNTRKQHGLLVMPIPSLDDGNHVLLSSFDETVIQHGAEFNLGVHKYQGDTYSPNGHKYIREFTCEIVPKSVYRVGGVILTKEKVFVSHANRILIKYTLEDAHSPTTLRFKPFLAFRNANALTQENEAIDRSYREVLGGVAMSLYPGYPTLYMQFSKPPVFVFQPVWNKGIEYLKELERGYPYKEDLYVPGYFELSIRKGESIYFSAGIDEIRPNTLQHLYTKELEQRTSRSSFRNCLINSAQQFYLKKERKGLFLLAGYPWFKVRARDLFIALPGSTLSLGDTKSFEAILSSGMRAMNRFLEKGVADETVTEIEMPDTPLWGIWAIQQYARNATLDACREKYGDQVVKLIDAISKGKHPNLYLHDNGLLYTNGREKAVSWMNSTVNGRPVVSRTGYLVEFNALWYNALCFGAALLDGTENENKAGHYRTLAETTAESFRSVFLNGYGYLFDYVDGNYTDWSVRPNMLFALSLEYSPLDKKQRKGVLDVVTRELLTPKGIRSLSPKSLGYNPNYVGTQLQRDYAYHQGTAWPWLMGAYAEAYLKVFGISGVSFLERMMIGYEEEMSNHCIGSISELFDGNPPFTGRGAISFAVNVAEILRVLNLLKEYNRIMDSKG